MAGSVNKVILIGNLGADPEIRRTQDGRPIANLRIATSESWRDKATGERKEKTEWHRVVIFSEGLCKIVEQYLKKGSKVYIEGQLQTRKYNDKDGVEKYSTEVVLQNFNSTLTMLDTRGGGGGGAMSPTTASARRARPRREARDGRRAASAATWTTKPSRRLWTHDNLRSKPASGRRGRNPRYMPSRRAAFPPKAKRPSPSGRPPPSPQIAGHLHLWRSSLGDVAACLCGPAPLTPPLSTFSPAVLSSPALSLFPAPRRGVRALRLRSRARHRPHIARPAPRAARRAAATAPHCR